MKNVKNQGTGQNYMKNGLFCHYLAMNGKLWVRENFLLDSYLVPEMILCKFRENRTLISVKNKLPNTHPYFDYLSELNQLLQPL